jgi:selenocysteine-specific elongation factor
MATLRLLGTDELAPGQQGWIQLELRHPLICVRGDAFVLRRPSPAETLGGGIVVDAQPLGRHRRFDPAMLSKLNSLAEGHPADVMFEAALALHAAPIRDVVMRSQLTAESAAVALSELLRTGKLVLLEHGQPLIESDLLAIALPEWKALRDEVGRMISDYHARYPLRRGVPREELKSQLDLSPRLFSAVIDRSTSDAALIQTENTIAQPSHRIRFDGRDQARVDSLLQAFRQSPYGPPSIKDCRAATGDEVFRALLDLGELVAVSDEIVFRKADYESMVMKVRGALATTGQVTLAEVRDLFQTSRKYAQALLEHLDAVGITRRAGDARVLAA